MGLLKVIIFLCVALFVANIITNNHKETLRKIPLIGNFLAEKKNLNLYIIIVVLLLLVLFL